MKKIYVPVDFSEATEAVVEEALSFSQAFDARIRLVHIEPPEPDFVGYDLDPPVLRDQVAAAHRKAHREVQELADRMRERGAVVKALCFQGYTVEAILDDAEKWGADIIVMGSHGHGRLARAVLGSVSEGVVRGAPCPVLVVPGRTPH